MNLLIGDRNQWYRSEIAGNAIFVRPAIHRDGDDPALSLFHRIADEIDRRVQSRRERLQSRFRWWLDFYPCRVIHRALKAQETPEIAWWEHLDGPIVRGLSWVVVGFGAVYLIAQIVRVWR